MLSSGYKEHYVKTLQLALPLCVSQLGHMLVGVTDTAFVGQLGYYEQAAVQLANSLYTLLLVFGLGVSIGVTPLIAAAHSRGDTQQAAALLKNALLVNMLTSLALFIILLLVSPVLQLFGQDAKVTSLAIPFLNVMMFSMIPLGFFSTYKQFAEGLSDTTIAMIISVGCNALNILLNYLLVFGRWGFPKMGMMGSCWASFIARIIMAFFMFLYVYRHHKFKSYIREFKKVKLTAAVSVKILKIGVPSGLQWLFEVGAFSFAVIMIGWIGAKAQAAHSIALNLAAITYMMASGLSSAVAVRVGNFVGLGDRNSIRKAGFSGLFIVIAFECITAGLFILFKNQLPLLFSGETEVVYLAGQLLIIAALFQISDGVQVIGLGALRGLNDVKLPTAITLIAYWVVGLPVSYWLAFNGGMNAEGIWYGLLAGLTVSAVALIGRFNYISKKFSGSGQVIVN